jgi:hypothetical protein
MRNDKARVRSVVESGTRAVPVNCSQRTAAGPAVSDEQFGCGEIERRTG